MFETHTYQIVKVINAPLRFVYDWCTDYREDDNKITGSSVQRRILEKTKRRAIYVSTYEREGKTKMGVDIVQLKPPKAWYLEYVGEEEDETGRYRLTSVGHHKTRLQMRFTEKYKIDNAPTKEEDRRHVDELWDKYVARLEAEYSATK